MTEVSERTKLLWNLFQGFSKLSRQEVNNAVISGDGHERELTLPTLFVRQSGFSRNLA